MTGPKIDVVEKTLKGRILVRALEYESPMRSSKGKRKLMTCSCEF